MPFHSANEPLPDFHGLQLAARRAGKGALHQPLNEALEAGDQIHAPL
jgi:hypothetical protein